MIEKTKPIGMNRNATFVLQHNKLETRNQTNGAEPKSFMSRKILNLIIMKKKNYFKKLALLFLVCSSQLIMAQVPSYVPTNGLVGYWPFSGNANDISGNANNGTNNGATLTTDRFGNVNSAYSFNGISNYIRITNTLLPNIPTSYTFSIWYNTQNFTTQNGDYRNLISDRNTNSYNYKYSIYLISSSHKLGGAIYNASAPSSNEVGGEAGLNSNWHNAVYIYDNNSASLYLYIDGILVSTLTNVSQWSNLANPTNIGCWNGPVGQRGYFDGKIDDIGIWNRALTSNEILSLYQAEVSCQSLVINSGTLSSFNPPVYQSTVTIYPNPANDHITIDCGTLANVVGYHIEIVNTLGQVVFNQPMNTQQYNVALNTWSGTGVYFVKIYDASNNLLNTKKIILQ